MGTYNKDIIIIIKLGGRGYRCIYHYICFDGLNLIMEECTEALARVAGSVWCGSIGSLLSPVSFLATLNITLLFPCC